MTFTPPDPSTYAIPSPASRAVRAVLYLIPMALIYVALPYIGLSQLSRYGISTNYSLGFIAVAGIVLAVLGAATSYCRPTRAYGPLSMLASAGSIVYLLILAKGSTASFSIGSGSLTLSYAGMMMAFAIVPLIRMGSGAVTTLEDALRPTERLPFDYPAR